MQKKLKSWSVMLLLVIPWLGTAACGRGPEGDSQAAIVGGTVPQDSSPAYHSTVALVTKDADGYTTLCSGILVAQDLVLTAAHCVESVRPTLTVLFGNADTDPLAKTVEIEKSQTYKPEGSRFFPNFDIAWVKLKGKAPAAWRPVEILRSPETLNAFEGRPSEILLAGYGRTASVCRTSACMGRLYEVWTTLQHFFNEAHFVNLLVIGPNPGHGTCNGDSGGPAFVKVGGQYLLAGILNGKSPLLNSPTLWERGVCESGEAIYNFPGAYVDWIEQTSGVKLRFNPNINPAGPAAAKLDAPALINDRSTLEDMLAFNNHHENLWATVEVLTSGFKDPVNRYGATVEELVTQSGLAASAMRRWKAFNHLGLSFDFVISSQKSNQLADVRPISKLTGLKTLSLDSNKIESTASLKALTHLENLTLRNNYDYSKKRKVAWDFNFIGELAELKTLDLSNNSGNLNLSSIAWEKLRNLEELKLSDNGKDLNLELIPWERLINLKRLTIRSSSLTGIASLSRAKSLEYLDLSRNQIASVAPLTSLQSLAYLDISLNQVSDFKPLANLSKLKNLKALSNVQAEEFCPTGAACVFSPAGLSTFESYCRFAFSLPPDDLALWSGGATVIRLIQIAGVEALRMEGCADAQAKLSRIRSLNLSGSPSMPKIEDLSPLGPLTQLESLNLANNDIRDIRSLATLTKVTNLDLSQNLIRDLTPIASLKALRYLNVDGNLIDSLEPLKAIDKLTAYARDNPLADESCPFLYGTCYYDESRLNPDL